MIVIDDREMYYCNRKDIRDIIRYIRIKYVFQRLEVGDYIINDKVIIERKTISDYISSLIDGRYKKQIYNLKNIDCITFLIVIGSINQFFDILITSKINYRHVIGSIVSAILRNPIEDKYNNFNLIILEDDRQFWWFIKKVDELTKNDDLKMYYPVAKKLNKNDVLISILSVIPGIGEGIARNIINELKISSIYDLIKVSDEKLLSVNKISNKRLESIRTYLGKTEESEHD